MLIFWIFIFLVSLFVLIKGSDLLLASAEKIGLRAGLSPFVVGVTIVGIGTSLPEIVSSIVAVTQGVTDVVIGNAVGSNIANILLIGGFTALMAKGLKVGKDLIDLDLPLLAITTVIFLMLAKDGIITRPEAFILFVTYAVYLLIALIYKEEGRAEENKQKTEPVNFKDIAFLIAGIIGLAIGAKFLIDAIIEISVIGNIATGVIAVTAVAIGTSLPELIVSAKAAARGNAEVALGNILGSNIFNVLMVVGLPGMFADLSMDPKTFSIGLPMLIVSTILFIISGISRTIHRQEAILYLMVYLIFTVQLFDWI